MARQLAVVALIAVVSGATGCASTWDTLLSRRFREKPFQTTFRPDDPMKVIRENPDWEAKTRAMARLKEPAASGGSEAEQEEVVQFLTEAATANPNPWVRMTAIDTLARFRDPRAVQVLASAYQNAPGRSGSAPPVKRSGPPRPGEPPGLLADRLGLHGPQGFPPDQVAAIRGRALEGLARTGRPEAVELLARVATGVDVPDDGDPANRDFVRQRAVAGLGQMRQKEAVVALAKVLSAEHDKDITLTHLAHGGLVSLTGKKEPADPQKWDAVIQAGFEIAPEPNLIERAVGAVTD